MGMEFRSYFRQAQQDIQALEQENLTRALLHVRNAVIDKLSKPGAGNEYKVPGTRNRRHTASAEGDPPAVLFGQLRSSISFEIEQLPDRFVGMVGPRGVPYARRLEFGFVGVDAAGRRYNQAPRPYLKPTFEEKREEIKQIVGGRR
ncbi:hypothetical protein LC040_12145 [Bacillus tianshenii]|nr:hypothetical protein LC040_12145 [Bacillus tianshenii]